MFCQLLWNYNVGKHKRISCRIWRLRFLFSCNFIDFLSFWWYICYSLRFCYEFSLFLRLSLQIYIVLRMFCKILDCVYGLVFFLCQIWRYFFNFLRNFKLLSDFFVKFEVVYFVCFFINFLFPLKFDGIFVKIWGSIVNSLCFYSLLWNFALFWEFLKVTLDIKFIYFSN